jgi:hypothetical protein
MAAGTLFAYEIQQAQDRIQEAKERIKLLRSKDARSLARFIKKMVPEGPTQYIYADGGNAIRVAINFDNLDSFKDEKLAQVLGFVSGFSEASNTYDGVYSNPFREYSFRGVSWNGKQFVPYHYGNGLIRVVFSVSAYVRQDSEYCRVVVVGKKWVEQEEKKIVCD